MWRFVANGYAPDSFTFVELSFPRRQFLSTQLPGANVYGDVQSFPTLVWQLSGVVLSSALGVDDDGRGRLLLGVGNGVAWE